MWTAPFKQPHATHTPTRPTRSSLSTHSPHRSHSPHLPHLLRTTTPLSILGILVVILTLLFSGTAAAKGGKAPFPTASGASPVQVPTPTPTPAAPPGAHGTPTQVSPTQARSSTGIQYRRDNERDPGREKDKDRNQTRRCARTTPGAPSPCRRPPPPPLHAARSYPTAAFLTTQAGSAALTTSRPGVATRPALHCLHCVFRC
ncbi:hypothetical protein [Streptomyces sp. NPDC059788]|uniref:hypothetical protein n=1 Tax=Streptomyces sp. NPDC059788 TaxID=3346948 RepID=UPI00365D6E46